MRIVIPTYRRTDRQRTLLALPAEWQARTSLICDEIDKPELVELRETVGSKFRIVVVPKKIKSIAKKRAWILERYVGEKIVMFDDDLKFCRRDYSRKPTFLRQAETNEVGIMLIWLEKKLEKFAHVSISPRQGNNNLEAKQRTAARIFPKSKRKKAMRWEPNYRAIYALGFDVDKVLKHCEIGRIEHREDMDYTLQLLRKGFPNRVLSEFAVDQVYNSKGGASVDRKIEDSNKDADKLARLHKGFVKVVDKKYSISMPRKEVIVQWKKAYASSNK